MSENLELERRNWKNWNGETRRIGKAKLEELERQNWKGKTGRTGTAKLEPGTGTWNPRRRKQQQLTTSEVKRRPANTNNTVVQKPKQSSVDSLRATFTADNDEVHQNWKVNKHTTQLETEIQNCKELYPLRRKPLHHSVKAFSTTSL